MTLDEFMQSLIQPNPEAEDSYDYKALAFDAGVEYAIKKIKEFLAAETKEITLPKYLKILNALSDNRRDENPDEETSWEESGYRIALYDVKKYLENDKESISNTLNEYKELED